MTNRAAAVGALLLSKGFAAEAIPFLKKAARINDLAPLVNLGAAYRWEDRFDEAEKVLERAVLVHPKSPEAWGNYGMLLEDVGRFKEATRAAGKAYKLVGGIL